MLTEHERSAMAVVDPGEIIIPATFGQGISKEKLAEQEGSRFSVVNLPDRRPLLSC
jgi:hypothetical protein